MEKGKNDDLLRKAFDIGVVLKGIDGLLESLGGILFLFIKPQTISEIVRILTQHELSEDPNDFFANYILDVSQKLSFSSKLFGAFYLLSHGVVKVVIVAGLLKNKLWAYKLGIFIIVVSIFYQTYRFILNQSVVMLILTVFDAVVVFLIWAEYKAQLKIRAEGGPDRT